MAQNTFGLEVKNDALANDRVFKGDILYVEPTAQFIDGSLYAVRFTGKELVHAFHIYELGKGRYRLVDGVTDIETKKGEIELLGKVTRVLRSL